MQSLSNGEIMKSKFFLLAALCFSGDAFSSGSLLTDTTDVVISAGLGLSLVYLGGQMHGSCDKSKKITRSCIEKVARTAGTLVFLSGYGTLMMSTLGGRTVLRRLACLSLPIVTSYYTSKKMFNYYSSKAEKLQIDNRSPWKRD